MKKLNKKGFTLIELLAVIVIMGILMVVAIPAVTRTINNTRKDTYLNTAKQYVNQVKTLWAGDGLKCDGAETGNTSTIADGKYYIKTDSLNDTLLDEGGKSPWKKEMAGVVYIDRASGKNTYSIYIVDSDGNYIGASADSLKGVAYSSLGRNKVNKLTTNTYKKDGDVGKLELAVPGGTPINSDPSFNIECSVDE